MATELLLGGLVYSSSVPDATALAVTDGVVTWVGSDAVGRALHPDARIIDLAGRFVAPAFVDSHVHLTSTGLALDGLTLSESTSRTDCLARLAAAADGADENELIWGLGWDDSTWAGVDPDDRRFPTTAEIDDVVGHRPVYLARIDEHSAVASTALRRLVTDLDAAEGYDPDAPLVAQAHHLVRAAARTLVTPATRARWQRRALDAAAAAGVVAVHENGGPEIAGLDDFLALADLDHPVEVRRYWGQAAQDAEHAAELLSITRADGLAGDLFVDGALGSHTAWLREPYTDDPDTSGINYLEPETIRTHIHACTLAGAQAGFHVIGDAATKAVIAAFASVADELGTPALARCAHRLEHVEMTDATDAAILARCGVIASMQPLFDAEWGGRERLYAQRLGPRADGLNDFAMLAKAGVALSFSSDSPVTAIDPWATIRAAVHPHRASSAISARAAFGACTRGAWRAGGVHDGLTGTLEPGARADYAVWEADDLVVAGSHAGVQRWSTDPRSRVPALPDVSPDARLPRCVRTVRAGSIIHDVDRGDW
ncbi:MULTISPECIES: amidohydrolase family protein [unclassified Gordonia (in: high G+C Gram-positive bacteria)]|uniref:amidohydrolase n=1 Tax=unclassified Gordonia (in: high G+C Gram-positive bacteria) TaxID=2657482 RepID=UPI0009AC24A7|nr:MULTISPECIES: amidohydrolase family protein [unclassified Gordonia (in: high G+C Gram-positive bacteria)]MDF3281936.1 amidohydrolase family protein [Gordonia sp. N1V]OPX15297.1 amidohydrolase [Gordonia sp. i37]